MDNYIYKIKLYNKRDSDSFKVKYIYGVSHLKLEAEIFLKRLSMLKNILDKIWMVSRRVLSDTIYYII